MSTEALFTEQPEQVETASEAKTPLARIYELLAEKYSQPHFVFLSEVRNSTGFDSNRSADAMALGMYRSRGRELWGFEIKVSRSDWLRELNNPQKADDIAQFCDHWVLVVSDESIVKPGELPSSWGLFALNGKRLKVVTPSPKLDPVPVDRHFFCAFVQQAMASIKKPQAAEMRKLLDARFNEGVEDGKRHTRYQLDAYEQLVAKVNEFEAASGVSIRQGWHGAKKIGAAVRAVLDCDDSSLVKLRRQYNMIRGIADDLEKQCTELAKLTGEVQA